MGYLLLKCLSFLKLLLKMLKKKRLILFVFSFIIIFRDELEKYEDFLTNRVINEEGLGNENS